MSSMQQLPSTLFNNVIYIFKSKLIIQVSPVINVRVGHEYPILITVKQVYYYHLAFIKEFKTYLIK